MLPKEHRLAKTKDFHRVLSGKHGIREQGLVLKAASSQEEVPRVGIVVSKKVSKKAVERNRIRRALQEAVSAHLPRLSPGSDIVLVALPGFHSENPADLRNTVHTLLKKASLLW